MVLLLLACSNGRNHPNSGNPAMEVEIGRCELAPWTVRLYEGRPGATVASWTSVTVEREGLSERQVAFAYAWPAWERVVCGPGGVELFAEGRVERTLPADGLEGLRSTPVHLYKGE